MSTRMLEFVNLLLPVLWATAGPAAVIAVTATANSLAKLYIPRAIQIPLAGIAGAIAAGLAGAPIEEGFAAGTVAQGALSIDPKAFLASAKGKA